MHDPITSSGPPQQRWFDKYVTQQVQGFKGNFTQLNFAAVKSVPAQDWDAAQAAEQQEAAVRSAAMAQATQSMYTQVEVPRARLNDGNTIPLVGLGTWKADKGQVRQAVRDALQAGYRHIDCAAVYQVGTLLLHHALVAAVAAALFRMAT